MSRNDLPTCQLCGLPPASREHAAETQRRWNALTAHPLYDGFCPICNGSCLQGFDNLATADVDEEAGDG